VTKNDLRCENCGKELHWNKNKGMFQCGVSKRFYYHRKYKGKLQKIMHMRTFCSRKCEKIVRSWRIEV